MQRIIRAITTWARRSRPTSNGMRTTLKATGIQLTPAISDYVEKKVALLQKLIDEGDTTALAAVEVGKTTTHHQHGDVFRAEINLRLSGSSFRAVAEASTLYAAIDIVKDTIEDDIQNKKRKRHTMLRRTGARIKDALRGISDFSLKQFRRKR